MRHEKTLEKTAAIIALDNGHKNRKR
jgi:hypothetical protein